MSHLLYSDEPEICSIHGIEMDGEFCSACEPSPVPYKFTLTFESKAREGGGLDWSVTTPTLASAVPDEMILTGVEIFAAHLRKSGVRRDLRGQRR